MTLNLLIFDFGFWIGGYKVRRGTREPNRTVGSLPFQGSVLRPITITVNGYQGYQDLRAHSGDKGGVYVVHWSRYTVKTLVNIGRSRGPSRYKTVTRRYKALQGVTARYKMRRESNIELNIERRTLKRLGVSIVASYDDAARGCIYLYTWGSFYPSTRQHPHKHW